MYFLLTNPGLEQGEEWFDIYLAGLEHQPTSAFEAYCEQLTLLASYIHYWGLNIHMLPLSSSFFHSLSFQAFSLYQTVNISTEGNVDCCFTRIPDMRAFWGGGEGWKWRDIVQCTIADQNPNINGIYLAWKSFAMHLLPLNKNASGCGDVFIAKLGCPEWDEHGQTAYKDIPNELLGSGLYKRVLERLAEN